MILPWFDSGVTVRCAHMTHRTRRSENGRSDAEWRRNILKRLSAIIGIDEGRPCIRRRPRVARSPETLATLMPEAGAWQLKVVQRSFVQI